VSADPDVLVRCPSCGEPSPSVKCYRTVDLLFLLFFCRYTYRNAVGCPRCVRREIGGYATRNVPTANVCWPLIGLVALGMWTASFTAGHSRRVRNLLA
jgi:hypothetical protein